MWALVGVHGEYTGLVRGVYMGVVLVVVDKPVWSKGAVVVVIKPVGMKIICQLKTRHGGPLYARLICIWFRASKS